MSCPHGKSLQAYEPDVKYDGCAYCTETKVVSQGFDTIHDKAGLGCFEPAKKDGAK